MLIQHHLTFLRDKTNGNSHDYSTGRETPNKISKVQTKEKATEATEDNPKHGRGLTA
jgi:hypothetical protein